MTKSPGLDSDERVLELLLLHSVEDDLQFSIVESLEHEGVENAVFDALLLVGGFRYDAWLEIFELVEVTVHFSRNRHPEIVFFLR